VRGSWREAEAGPGRRGAAVARPVRATLARVTGRVVLNALIGVALLAEFIALAGHALFGSGPPDYAATPRSLVVRAPQPPTGRQVLLALAATAEASPAEPGARTRAAYAYVERESWQLPADRAEAMRADVTVTLTQSWRRRRGGGRVLSTIESRGRVIATRITTGAPVPVLSADASLLRRRLGIGASSDEQSSAALVRFVGLADAEPIAPRVEAGILRLLAAIPGVIADGTVSDRAGRAGDAVSLDSEDAGRSVRYTLVFAADTGRLQEADETFIGDGPADVPEGATLAYTTFIATGYTANTMTRP